MNLEESKGNINCDGLQSVVLVLREEFRKSFSALLALDNFFYPYADDLIGILLGDCCERDYVIVGHDLDTTQLAEQLMEVVREHGYIESSEDESEYYNLAHHLVTHFTTTEHVTWGIQKPSN